jgi:subfamily B ATP-binding cassette protein MsbA
MELRQSLMSNLGALVVNLISMSVLVFAIWYGGYRVIQGELTLGTLLALYTYLVSLFAPAEAIANFWSNAQEPLASIQRVLEIEQRLPRIRDPRDAISPKTVTGGVRFERVTFGYEPGTPVLQNFSVRVRPGEHVGIVGPTGCGKTTIAYLLLRIYQPQRGRVLVDGTDVARIRLHALRKFVAYLPQETTLFNTTLRENIAIGAGRKTTLGEIRQVAGLLGLDDLVRSWPQRYDTILGEKGMKLSAGQRQLIGLTRLLLRDARVVILDEATSFLDAVTEARVQHALAAALKGRTAIFIAHRLRTVAELDRVLVLESGRIVEEGAFEDLKVHGKAFKRFYQAQKV